jgi:hypothetical protein
LSNDEKYSSVRKIELKNDLSQDGMANILDQGDLIEENKKEMERRKSIPKSYLKNTVKFDQADIKNSAGRVFETKNSNITVEDSRNSGIFITNQKSVKLPKIRGTSEQSKILHKATFQGPNVIPGGERLMPNDPSVA